MVSLLILAISCYVFYELIQNTRQGVKHVRRLHSIPCTGCVYFTGEMLLKCPVNPKAALTEQAIDCVDFVGKG